MPIIGDGRELGHHPFGQIQQVHRFGRCGGGRGVQPGHGQQLLDQMRGAVEAGAQLVQRSRSFRVIRGPLRDFGLEPYRRQRGAQFVGGVGDKLALRGEGAPAAPAGR